MSAALEQVRTRVASQRTLLPALYGKIDFGRMPERFSEDASEAIVKDRAPIGVAMMDYELELVRADTMRGDIVADAYAALIPGTATAPADLHAARGLRPERRKGRRGPSCSTS